MKINLNWPATKENRMVPWYVILYRLPCFIIMHISFSISFIGILLANGPNDAIKWWKRQ